jgi:predicted phosphodiesterase
MRRVLATMTVAACVMTAYAQQLALPNQKDSVKFAVIGDGGTGGSGQRQVADRLAATHKLFPFEFAIMLGDNLYGSEREGDYQRKFERPYKALLDAGVKFYASLGNHDDPNQRFYKHFNMGGERYYSFKPPRASVRLFSIDSNYMTEEQLKWLEKELSGSDSDWKIAFFHHPLYSSGERHGSDEELRTRIEPLFVKHGVDVVFTGHEHFYERIKPQQGITYFVAGSSAKLRRGNIASGSALTAKGYDQGYTFMVVEIAGDDLYFQTITDKGQTVDSGTIRRREAKPVGTTGR